MIVAPVVHLRVSVEGSSPPGPPVEGNTWRQHTGEGSRAPRLVALALQILVEQEESKKQQQQQQRGGPQRPGAPSGQHGRLRSGGGGSQGGARPRAVDSIAGPTNPGGREEGRPWGGGARRTPGMLPRCVATSPTPAAGEVGPYSSRSQPGCGRWEGWVERGGGRGQTRLSRSRPRPQPGFRFHLRLAEPDGEGRPPRGGSLPHPCSGIPPSPSSGEEPKKAAGLLEEAEGAYGKA